ncbi:MAG TPA: formate--tetrahydrofolate ligase [Thermotogales bacterium]|nr:formate--tetrahydrofolate ligase [Thermotogales bacterium]
MPSDIEIARSIKLKPITEITSSLGIPDEVVYPYGKYMAKIDYKYLKKIEEMKDGKLIIVTAMSPTKFGEGKTTTSIGLSLALNRMGKKAIVTLREPSLGPVMGIKGGATGGGYSQVLPMEDINLHFTGDFHAVSSAHNLLSALIDAHIKFKNELRIDPSNVFWPRAIDMNDRALRSIVVALGGSVNGQPREDKFVITAASEIMAILCLSKDLEDLKKRLGNIVIAKNLDGDFVKAKDLKAEGAMAVLLKDAINPNVVQTTEGTPAFIHGGPFANIAHGTNSILATKLALKLADYVVTETGFGADLGAEKFFDVVAPTAGFSPDVVVIVATLRALKVHGGVEEKNIDEENMEALKSGMANLIQHVENVRKFGLPLVVAINRFRTDTDRELNTLIDELEKRNIPTALSTVWKDGGEGGLDLARKVVELSEKPKNFEPIYDWGDPIKVKIEKLAKEIYRAGRVEYTSRANSRIRDLEKKGYGNLPIVVAKTQYSFSDDPKLLGAPRDYTFTVRDLYPSGGAGFIVVLSGDIMTMPGLPKVPNAVKMDITPDGLIEGLF